MPPVARATGQLSSTARPNGDHLVPPIRTRTRLLTWLCPDSPSSQTGSEHDDDHPGLRSESIITMLFARAQNLWLIVIAFCVGTISVPAHADYPVAPDVVVFCE